MFSPDDASDVEEDIEEDVDPEEGALLDGQVSTSKCRLDSALAAEGAKDGLLGKENEIGSSLFSLTVLPAYGKPKQDPITNGTVPIANKASKKAYKVPSKQVECKSKLSWADIIKR